MTDAALTRFNESYEAVTESGCWLWLGPSSGRGYGVLSIGGKSIRAHRYAYEQFKGPIPCGLFVCHSCDVPACVNPDHLWVGTATDNNRDRDMKGRTVAHNDLKTHCKRGHPFDRDNTRTYGGDYRHCRTCQKLADALRPERNKRRNGTAAYASGSRNPQAKLTDGTVAEMRRRYHGGETITALAKAFGVSRKAVFQIVRGLTWKHVAIINEEAP